MIRLRQDKWWASDLDDIRYASYQVGDTEFLVGSRPDWGVTPEFYDSITAWISVIDEFISIPPNGHYYWFPWDETKPMSDEVVFGLMHMLNNLFRVKAKRVYVHCAAGTNRSPTVLGLFLRTFVPSEVAYIESLGGRSNPINYSGFYLADHPQVSLLLDWIKNNPKSMLQNFHSR